MGLWEGSKLESQYGKKKKKKKFTYKRKILVLMKMLRQLPRKYLCLKFVPIQQYIGLK